MASSIQWHRFAPFLKIAHSKKSFLMILIRISMPKRIVKICLQIYRKFDQFFRLSGNAILSKRKCQQRFCAQRWLKNQLATTRSNWCHKFCQNVWTLPAACLYLPIYIKSKINFLSPKFEFPAQTTSRSSLRLIHTRAFDACGCSGKLEKFLSLRQCDCLPQPHVSNVHYVNVPVLG